MAPTSDVRTLTRSDTIAAIRAVLLEQVDDESSVCRVAAREGIFCRGFARWGDAELRRRFAWATSVWPGLDRERLEGLANRWQLSRQSLSKRRLPCDAAAKAPGTSPCKGWNEFTDAELARFHRDLCGLEVRVLPDHHSPRLRR